MKRKTALQLALHDRGLNLSALAERLGINKATVTRWSQTKVPAEKVLEVEQACGVPRHKLRPDLFEEAA